MMKRIFKAGPARELPDLKVVNADPRYGKAPLIQPTNLGYLHIAAEVSPPRLPFLPAGRRRARLLAGLVEMARQLEGLDAVEKVTVFEAIAAPPVSRLPYLRDYIKERAGSVQVARFDLVVLIETTTPTVIREVQGSPAYRALVASLGSEAGRLHVVAARNAKRIGDVDKTRPGVFLFNYFVADDPAVMLQLWEYLAGWYAVETGLHNSTLLVPLDGERSEYPAINHARWDESLPRVLARQLAKKSFRTYVLANLEAYRVGSMPIFYRLAVEPRRPIGVRPSWLLALGAGAMAAVLAWRSMQRRAGQSVVAGSLPPYT